MKTFLGIMVLLCILGLSSGCHSGTTRGMGADLSRMGNSLQK